jgi:hypothetical protein
MRSITEIKRRAHIYDVWAALGGNKLRAGRGQAFWRKGDGFSISLDPAKGLWHDFVSGEGGDVIALVRIVRQCSFVDACEWLARHCGIPVSESICRAGEADTDWRTDLLWATWWRMAAEALAEEALAADDPPVWNQPCAERHGMTALLAASRSGDAALVAEYRNWRRGDPELTTAMAQAGRLHDAHLQRRLMRWLMRMYG